MKRTILAITSLLIGISALFVAPPVLAVVDNTPDDDTVAIIRNGVFSMTELRQKAQQGDVPRVFGAFGIQQTELNGMVDGVVWKDGRVTVGRDRVVARNAVTAGRWNNPTADMTRIPNTDRAYKMSTSHFTDEGQTAFIKMVDGKFRFAVIKPCGNPVTATPETPNYKCDNLTKERVSRNAFRFTAKATADNGAKIVKYRFNFGDGTTKEQAGQSITHTYAQPGNYTVRVTAIVNVNGKEVEATGADCTKQVTVEAEKTPAIAKYECKYMNLRFVDKERRIVQTDTQYSAQNATFSHFLYDFGDGTPVVKSTDATVEHTYASDGTYTAKAHAVFKVSNQEKSVTSETCAKQVSFTTDRPPQVTPPTPQPPTPTPPTTAPQPEAPAVLVDTGTGAVVGAALSVITGGTLAYRFVWLRRYLS